METATFGAGCFWGIEATFQKIKGVIKTTVGYMGGNLKNPTYEQVCTDKTGHAEVIQMIYNPEQINYEKLLEIFWEIHDPTQLNRQGPDIGIQYRSVIFYHNEKQKKLAEESKNKQQKNYNKKIVTEITPAIKFYPAEEYHQKYLEKQGLSSCKI
jgi:peptide-methionine (S)-S-oxide reductase